MIVVVGNIKGGVGKTMLAVNIAAALAQDSQDVLLIDGDEQASAAMFARVRAEREGLATTYTTIQLQGAAIRQQMLHLMRKYDRIVIDVGGRESGSLRAALTIADAILIPFQPRSVDLWTGRQMGALLTEARHVNEKLQAFGILNLADPRGSDNVDAGEALTMMVGIKPLPQLVGRRKAFPNAFSRGLSVLEDSKDPKAVRDILCLVDALYAELGNSQQYAAHRKAG